MKVLYMILIMMMMNKVTFGQQNLFNIPSGDITPDRKIFFQQQVNLYSLNSLESKSHFVYGHTGKSEVGLNIINVPFDFKRKDNYFLGNEGRKNLPLFPAILLTWQYNLWAKGKFKLNVGTQTGINIAKKLENIRILYMHYALSVFQIGKKGRIVAGPYYVNKYLAGMYNVGVMAGYEFPVTKRFYLMGDYISGNHAKSSTVLGAIYCINKRIQLCAGYLVPFPNEDSKQGIVLELNVLGYDY